MTSHWNHVYPLHLADAADDDHLLPASGEWAENLDGELRDSLKAAYGRRPGIEEVAWYVFGTLSAPSYRRSFAAALAIDHPRVPFPASIGAFERMAEFGRRLGAAHLLEVPILPDIRFVGEGSSIVEQIRHDPDSGSVSINPSQRFTGVPSEAWVWGLGFRPLEHFLVDRKGRRLDGEQIAMFQGAITAVRESIALASELDVALADVLAETLELRLGASPLGTVEDG